MVSINVGVHQGCLMSPWLLNNVYGWGITYNESKMDDCSVLLNHCGIEKKLPLLLYANDAVLIS